VADLSRSDAGPADQHGRRTSDGGSDKDKSPSAFSLGKLNIKKPTLKKVVLVINLTLHSLNIWAQKNSSQMSALAVYMVETVLHFTLWLKDGALLSQTSLYIHTLCIHLTLTFNRLLNFISFQVVRNGCRVIKQKYNAAILKCCP
jgi:hypothetical protein